MCAYLDGAESAMGEAGTTNIRDVCCLPWLDVQCGFLFLTSPQLYIVQSFLYFFDVLR